MDFLYLIKTWPHDAFLDLQSCCVAQGLRIDFASSGEPIALCPNHSALGLDEIDRITVRNAKPQPASPPSADPDKPKPAKKRSEEG